MASSSAETNLATAKTILSTAASVAATAMLVRSIAQDFIPFEIQHYLFSSFKNLFNTFSSQLNIVIQEFDGLMNNQIYEAAESYLSTKISPSTQKLKASKSVKENNINISMERDQVIVDDFQGVKITWILVCKRNDSPAPNNYIHNVRDLNSMLRSETRSFEINFHKKHRDMILKTYLPYVVNEARKIKQVKKTLKIFTNDSVNIYNGSDAWMSTNLDHPATFETLALDLEMKNFIVEDLERFVARKEYYKKVGKAWKRGYLLYGPPGTGKSSLIAAMANYLKFDVYDLELTEIRCNSELRRLLIAMANRSILVVEDIDCSIEFQDRMNNNKPRMINRRGFDQDQKVTLSGLLNFIDGLWSSCGDERIIVFTTNHKEKLDSALLRPGRMDVHVHMSYCTPSGFRLLAANYLGIKDHTLFGEIEQELQSTQVTPAEVAEQLIKSDDHDNTLNNLPEFFRLKRRENEEARAKNDIGKGELGDKEVHNETEDNEVDNDDKSDIDFSHN